MIGRIKSMLLTYLFKDWVKKETDVELIQLTTQLLKQREVEIVGHKPVLGFRQHSKNDTTN